MTSFSVDLAALEDAAAGINSTINELRSRLRGETHVLDAGRHIGSLQSL